MADKCLFCGTGGVKLSNEHVTPKWLLEYLELPEDDQMVQGVAYSNTGALCEPPRIHSSFNFVQGHVCKVDCNEGWMRRLEEQVRPILIPLIDNERSVAGLSSAGRSVVGKWAVKTAYLHTWTAPIKRPVPLDHVHALNGDDGYPNHAVSVFAMQNTYVKPTGYIQSWFWPQRGTPLEKSPGESPDGAYKIGMQFKHLYLLVAFWPNPNSTFMLMPFHAPVLPLTVPDWVRYTAPVNLGNGPIDRLALFTNSLVAWNT